MPDPATVISISIALGVANVISLVAIFTNGNRNIQLKRIADSLEKIAKKDKEP